MHLRGIPSEVERLAKMEAARRGVSLSDFVTAAILAASHSAETDAERRLAPIASERLWYDANREAVAQEYAKKIVAISGSGVIYAGDTLVEVAKEVRARIGDRPVYVVDLTGKRGPGPSPARGSA